MRQALYPSGGVWLNSGLVMALTNERLDFSTQFQFSFGDLLAVALPGDHKVHDWKFDVRNQIEIYYGQHL
jgi:hypothetical protein